MMARRMTVQVSEQNGPLVGLAGLLIAGFIVGLIAGAIWARVSQEGLGESDYLLMVSMLYDQDRSLPNAVDRLATLDDGDVVRTLSALADTYPKSHPEAQNEARALRQLASTLNGPTGEVKVPKSGGGGIGGVWLALGVVLVLVCILGIGGPLVFEYVQSTRRTLPAPVEALLRFLAAIRNSRSLRRPMIGGRSSRTNRRSSMHQSGFGRPIDGSSSTRLRREGTGFGRPLSDAKAAGNHGGEQPMRQHPITSSGAFAREDPSLRAKAQVTERDMSHGARLESAFQSRYQFGDEPFDQVHSITDRATGEMIGACGLSAELTLTDEIPGRYYVFSAWAQDYGPGGALKRIAIVSNWARENEPSQLTRWIERNRIDEVVVASPGARLLIDTANLAVDMAIMNVSYGSEADLPPDSFIANLAAGCEVYIKDKASVN